MLFRALLREPGTRRFISRSAIAKAAKPLGDEPVVTIAATPVQPNVVTRPVIVKKRAGGFRGGLFGFFFGLAAAGSGAYYYHVEEYKKASGMLLNAVDELNKSTDKVSNYARKIESLEKELASLKANAASQKDMAKLRDELKHLYSEQNVQHLELKSHVWGLEQDVDSLLKASKK